MTTPSTAAKSLISRLLPATFAGLSILTLALDQTMILAATQPAIQDSLDLEQDPEDWEAFHAGMNRLLARDFVEAANLFQPLADRGYGLPNYLLGILHDFELKEGADVHRAIAHYERAVEARCPQAAVLLAQIYYAGDGVAVDMSLAHQWIERGAVFGDAVAQWLLADLYNGGRSASGRRDLAEALAWIRIAAETGHEGAREILPELERTASIQDLTERADFVEKNRRQQIQTEKEQGAIFSLSLPLSTIIEGAARSKEDSSSEELSTATPPQSELQRGEEACLNGDYRAAMEILLPVAEAGEPNAQFYVARMLEKGRGVTKDEFTAARWYTRSAQQGNPSSQDNLGLMYMRGRGVDKDAVAASKLFYLAAINGHRDGQLNIGYCCATGTGVRRDLVEGYAWYILAAEKNDPTAPRNMRACEQEMTADQIEAAERRAAIYRQMIEEDGFDRNTLPDVPVADFSSQPEPRVAPQPRPPIFADSDPYSGTWRGMARDEYDDGSIAETPIEVELTKRGSEYWASVRADRKALGEDDEPLTLRYRGTFRGTVKNGLLEMQSTLVELHVVELDQNVPMGNHTLSITSDGARLEGRGGNDEEGWTSFTATRDQ